MKLGKVIGNVVSTIKYEKLAGIKLSIVRPIDPDGNVYGNTEIVGDFLNCPIGNLVFWIDDGATICKRMNVMSIPLRGSIVGIIDKIDMEKEKKVIKGYL